jgi:hypothetical protein
MSLKEFDDSDGLECRAGDVPNELLIDASVRRIFATKAEKREPAPVSPALPDAWGDLLSGWRHLRVCLQ